MQHSLIMTHVNQTARSHRTTSATPWFWQVIGITAFLCLGLASEGLASHVVRPSSLTFNAMQGTNPPKQTLTFTKTPTYQATLTASDNATWLTVSPASQSETTRATLTVAVNTSGRASGNIQSHHHSQGGHLVHSKYPCDVGYLVRYLLAPVLLPPRHLPPLSGGTRSPAPSLAIKSTWGRHPASIPEPLRSVTSRHRP